MRDSLTQAKWDREKRRWLIYVLIDPRDGSVRYVGRTSSCDVSVRLRQHIKYPCAQAKGSWIRLLKSLGMEPRAAVMDEVRGDRWRAQRVERKWISLIRDAGEPLCNREALATR